MSPEQQRSGGAGEDLLPTVKKNFNARRTLHKAIDTVRAINKLREGGGLMSGPMDGQMSLDPKPKGEAVHGSKVMDDQGTPVDGGAQGGGLHGDPADPAQGDAMDIDSRGNGHGQTPDQIERQSMRVNQMINDHYQKNRAMK